MALTEPISVSKVKQALGGVATNKVRELCTHQAINKWSKWKPVRKDNVSGITYTDLVGINFGMGLPFISPNTPERLKTMYQNGTANWVYRRPRGGQTNEPYRLGDFRNYNRYANNPMGGYHVTPKVQNQGLSTTVMGSVLIARESNDYTIGFDELAQEYKYLGMAIFNSSGTMVKDSVNHTPNASTVEIDVGGSASSRLPAGNYKAIMYLTDSFFLPDNPQITALDGFPQNLFDIEVVDTPLLGEVNTFLKGIFINVGADNMGLPSVVVDIDNSTLDNILTFNNVVGKLRYADKAFDDPLTAGEQVINLGTITRDTDTTAGRRILFNYQEVDVTKGWLVWWRCTGTYARTQSVNILTPQ